MILTLNSGSSSLKFALYRFGPAEALELAGKLDRIGLPAGSFRAQDARGETLVTQAVALPDHEAALERLFAWLRGHGVAQRLAAVGHRVVHGGERFTEPQLITPALRAALQAVIPMAPDHLPTS